MEKWLYFNVLIAFVPVLFTALMNYSASKPTWEHMLKTTDITFYCIVLSATLLIELIYKRVAISHKFSLFVLVFILMGSGFIYGAISMNLIDEEKLIVTSSENKSKEIKNKLSTPNSDVTHIVNFIDEQDKKIQEQTNLISTTRISLIKISGIIAGLTLLLTTILQVKLERIRW